MRLSIIRTLAACVLLGFVSGAVGHDLIQEPTWRDWLYGSITEPDHVANGTRNFQFAQTNPAQPESTSLPVTSS